MIRRTSIVGSLVIALVAFLAGAVVSQRLGWGRSEGTVTFLNQSGAEVRSMQVAVDTCGRKITIDGGELPSGGTAVLRYHICGEGGQTLRAVLTDGKTVVSGEAYVESGYRGKAVISSHGIEVD